MKNAKNFIILASGSLWRKRLLKRNGISLKVHVSDFEEKIVHKSPRELALFNARGKAKSVAAHYSKGIIIGVDTIGVLGRSILLKPRDRADAARMIRALSGRRHRVISGLCVIDVKTGKRIEKAVTTYITFRPVSDEELEKYLNSNHWKGKAGAYAIQGRAKGFVEKIEGDITNVIGLPLPTLKEILKSMQAN